MDTTDDRLRAIRKYWDERAVESGTRPQATTQDTWMRQIEIRVLGQILAGSGDRRRILDIGCGNGFSTLELARRLDRLVFVGGDVSEQMVAAAQRARGAAPADLRDRVQFVVLDVLNLAAYRGAFDGVISDRCLINLPEPRLQGEAVAQIHAALRPGGCFIAIENFTDGQQAFNQLRAAVGMEPIPVRWHNLYLDPQEFARQCSEYFVLEELLPISSLYYLVTRVVYSKLCRNEGREPDYDHPIYAVAAELPFAGDFGPIRLARFRKR